MNAAGVFLAVLVAATAALMARPRAQLDEQARVVPPDDRARLARCRPLLAPACGLGAYLFLGGPVGLAAAVLSAGFAWRMLGRLESPETVRRRRALQQDLPVAVDLLVGAFRSGAAPGSALSLVGAALPGPVADEFAALCHRLDLGTDPALVWRDLTGHPQLGPLGRALGRAHATGSSVVGAGEHLADELRERSLAEVEARARSVSTKAAAPLGACFLPAFVLLGIVPVVAGLLGSLQLFG